MCVTAALSAAFRFTAVFERSYIGLLSYVIINTSAGTLMTLEIK